MHLRPPQADALRKVTMLLQRLPRPLSDCTAEERRSYLTDGDRWQHVAHPNFSLSLATGIGKTRLAGAIMALLYLSKESRTFLILAPRRAVLRRFSDALNPSFREYIFVEPGLVPEPLVVTADQIASPSGVEAVVEMFRTGPTVYLLSPQLIATSDRFRAPQAYTGKSPLEHLRGKQDLVVLVDEAHHIGGVGKMEAAKWTEAIRDIAPAVQFGLTATPRNEPGENLLYDYPLSRALIEQLYTKDVHLLVRKFEGSLLADEDVDLATIRYALERLAMKQAAIEECSVAPFPSVKSVCVFFARDIPHAEWVAGVLRDTHGLADSDVLVTHSKSSKREEELERLLSIEDVGNPVRVVVNVQELTEGWDVRNVFVVAPLRAMATFQGALQAMGRGLRLPAGRRVGHPEVDSLDVICFGKESLKAIVEQATSWLGKKVGESTGGVIIDDFDAGPRVVCALEIPLQKNVSVPNLVELEPVHEDVHVDVAPGAIAKSARMAVDELELVRLKSRFAKQRVVTVPRQSFVHATVMRTLRVASNYLSDDVNYEQIRTIVEGWLQSTGVSAADVDFDPAEVGEEIGRIIVDGARKRSLLYQPTGRDLELDLRAFTVDVVRPTDVGGQAVGVSLSDLPIVSVGSFAQGMVVRGFDGHEWAQSLHPAYSFDSVPELRLAWLLDHDGDVEWWMRNQPRRLRLPTPAGTHSPDFILQTRGGLFLMVEVKGSIYWQPPDSEARVKARSAARWVEAQNAAGLAKVDYAVLLDSDVEGAASFASAL